MANRTYTNETRVRAENVPDYVGWTLQGALARDGSLLWGEILSAEVKDVRDVRCLVVTYAHNVRGTVVPDGQTISLATPDGPHCPTLTKAATFSDCRGGESVGVDTHNGLEIHAGDGYWHPWDDAENGNPYA